MKFDSSFLMLDNHIKMCYINERDGYGNVFILKKEKIMRERRKNYRFKVFFPVQCIILQGRKKYFYTICKDLCLTGIKILSDNFLPQGKDMKINIDLIDVNAPIKAHILWCNKELFTTRYYAGLRFYRLSKEAKHHLKTFIGKIYSN
ncbi:MAG: hypothetical protein B6D55_02615 [Candidatus Omnitrophica bacterium 4484_70.2]|nr:MAG: hypothetical protein B6D55_02615 [Candidatus Omnitrophica bacterium 4484_70.2]